MYTYSIHPNKAAQQIPRAGLRLNAARSDLNTQNQRVHGQLLVIYCVRRMSRFAKAMHCQTIMCSGF